MNQQGSPQGQHTKRNHWCSYQQLNMQNISIDQKWNQLSPFLLYIDKYIYMTFQTLIVNQSTLRLFQFDLCTH